MKALERRAIARLQRRQERLLQQIGALVADRFQAAIRADPELLALVQAPDTNPDNPDTWGPELKRRGRLVFEEIVAVIGAGRLVEEHDRLAERLNLYYYGNEVEP